jgi:hypothetical protein
LVLFLGIGWIWFFGHWILITVISNQSTSDTNVAPGGNGYKSASALYPGYGIQPLVRKITKTNTVCETLMLAIKLIRAEFEGDLRCLGIAGCRF